MPAYLALVLRLCKAAGGASPDRPPGYVIHLRLPEGYNDGKILLLRAVASIHK